MYEYEKEYWFDRWMRYLDEESEMDAPPVIYKPYDKVWIMESNKPKQKLVFAVVESMDFTKRLTEFHYHLVDEVCGTGWGNYEGVRRSADMVYATKEELMESL